MLITPSFCWKCSWHKTQAKSLGFSSLLPVHIIFWTGNLSGVFHFHWARSMKCLQDERASFSIMTEIPRGVIFKSLHRWGWCWYSSASSGCSHQLSVWCSIAAKPWTLRMVKLPLAHPFFFFFFHIQVHLRQGVQVYYCLKRRQILSLSLEMDFCTLVPNAEGGKVCVYRGSGKGRMYACVLLARALCVSLFTFITFPWYILESVLFEVSKWIWLLHISNAFRKCWFLLNCISRAHE